MNRAETSHVMPHPSDDGALLQAWGSRRDETSFRELCARHARLVAGACRRLGSPDVDEAAQAVFLVLARRAGSVDGASLAGWLTLTTRRVVADQHRAALRRRRHEQEAAMEHARQHADAPPPEPAWAEVRRHLDEALGSLSAGRREALVRYYLEGKPQAEVAAELGCSEAAVKTRVHEGLDRLRAFFSRRGLSLGAAALASGLASEAAAAAEPTLAATCAQAVFAPVAVPGAATLATGVTTAMFIKSAALAAAATLVLGSALAATIIVGAETAASPPPPAVAPAPALSAAQRTAIIALYERAVAAGLPDAKGGTLLVGSVDVTAPVSGIMPSSKGTLVSINGKEVVFRFNSAHLRFADGTWLVNLVARLQTDATHQVTLGEGTQEVKPAGLAAACARKPAASRRWRLTSAPSLTEFTLAERERLRSCLEVADPFIENGIDARRGPIAILHLLRLGVAQADALLLVTAASSVHPFTDQVCLLSAPGPLCMRGAPPSGNDIVRQAWLHNEAHQLDWQRFQKDHEGKLSIPAPEAVAGQILASWFYNLLLDADALAASGLTAGAVAETTLAFAPADSRAFLRPLLARLVARLDLPETAAADADLATRLQSWQPEAGDLPLGASGSRTLLMPGGPASAGRTGGWRPDEADLPALLELLTAAGPSRWLDGLSPRTCGDNALRALGSAFGFDPRLLVGRDVEAGWSESERLATAQALRAWWKAQAGRPLAAGLVATIGSLTPAGMSAVLASRPAEARPPLLDAIVTAWTAKPPVDQPRDVGRVLGAAADHAGLTALVKTWKPAGRLRPLLACWRDRQGDPGPLDALLDELVAVKPEPGQAAAAPGSQAQRSDVLAVALAQSMRSPSPARLTRSLALARLEPADYRTWAVLKATGTAGSSDAEWGAVFFLDSGPDRFRTGAAQGSGQIGVQRVNASPSPSGAERAIPLAVACAFLTDQRVIPGNAGCSFALRASGARVLLAGTEFLVSLPGENPCQGDDSVDRQPPAGLRVCDLAAVELIQRSTWKFGVEDAARELFKQRPDPWSPVEARDRSIRLIAAAFAEAGRAALLAARLPEVIPTAIPAADKDAF